MGKAILIVLTNTKELPSPSPHHHSTANSKESSESRRTGFDVKEAALAYYYLHKKLGLELNLASPKGGECFLDPASLKASEHEEEVQTFLADPCAMQWVKCTDRLGNFDLGRFQAILFIGGPGAMFDFTESRELAKVAQHIYDNPAGGGRGGGGIIAAIGHGAAALLSIRKEDGTLWLKDRQVTANTKEEDQEMRLEKDLPFSIESKLSESGANFKKATKFSNNVVVDRRLITGQNRNSTREWLTQIHNHLQN